MPMCNALNSLCTPQVARTPQGLHVGDVIVSIDDVIVQHDPLDIVVQLLSAATRVQFVVSRTERRPASRRGSGSASAVCESPVSHHGLVKLSSTVFLLRVRLPRA